MLAGGDRAFAQIAGLHAADEGDADRGAQERVFPVGFVNSAPTGVPVHIQHGREHVIDANRPSFAAGHPGHLLDELRLKGGRQADGGGEGGGAVVG